MGLRIWWGAGDAAGWLSMSTWQRSVKLMLWVGLGGGFYFAALYIMGLRVQSMWLATEADSE
jgi:hypothetical protein